LCTQEFECEQEYGLVSSFQICSLVSEPIQREKKNMGVVDRVY